jgi:hypothetical protein
MENVAPNKTMLLCPSARPELTDSTVKSVDINSADFSYLLSWYQDLHDL